MFCGNIGCRICLIIEVFMWRNGLIVIGFIERMYDIDECNSFNILLDL